MCGIVGLFLKDKSLEPELGMMLSDMLVTMTDRGPDSAGIAIYGNDEKSSGKITIQSDNPDENFKNLDKEISTITGTPVSLKIKSTHAVLDVETSSIPAVRKALKEGSSKCTNNECGRHNRNLQRGGIAKRCCC